MTSTQSSVFFTVFLAASAALRATVKIVPSVGLITALYAVSTPLVIASAKSCVVQLCFLDILLRQPRKISDKITPELPLAPINKPLANASPWSPTLVDFDSETYL